MFWIKEQKRLSSLWDTYDKRTCYANGPTCLRPRHHRLLPPFNALPGLQRLEDEHHLFGLPRGGSEAWLRHVYRMPGSGYAGGCVHRRRYQARLRVRHFRPVDGCHDRPGHRGLGCFSYDPIGQLEDPQHQRDAGATLQRAGPAHQRGHHVVLRRDDLGDSGDRYRNDSQCGAWMGNGVGHARGWLGRDRLHLSRRYVVCLPDGFHPVCAHDRGSLLPHATDRARFSRWLAGAIGESPRILPALRRDRLRSHFFFFSVVFSGAAHRPRHLAKSLYRQGHESGEARHHHRRSILCNLRCCDFCHRNGCRSQISRPGRFSDGVCQGGGGSATGWREWDRAGR